MAIIFVDGSAFRKTRQKQNWVGWGVRAHFNGTSLEVSGSMLVTRDLKGTYEIIAFIEGLLLMTNRGIPLDEMSFYTDDSMVGYAHEFLHPDNFSATRAMVITTRIKLVCDALYTSSVFELVLECLRKSRFTKVKGHSGIVDNSRVDYLARTSVGDAVVLPYADWFKWHVHVAPSSNYVNSSVC